MRSTADPGTTPVNIRSTAGAGAPGLDVRGHVEPDGWVVALTGELDLATHLVVIGACAEHDDLPVIVDMAALTFLDCGGYRAIATARASALMHDRRFTVRLAQGEPAHILDLIDHVARPAVPTLTAGSGPGPKRCPLTPHQDEVPR